MPFSHDRRPRILFLIPSLAGGGAEKVASLLIPDLAAEFDLTLALLEDWRSFDLLGHIRTIAFSRRLHRPLAHLLSIPRHFFSLVRLIRRERMPLVLSSMEQANILNILASFITGHAAVIAQHNSPLQQYRRKGLLGRLILGASKCLYPKAARIIAVSEGIKDVLVRDYRIAPSQITVIPNPIDLRALQQQAGVEPSLGLPPKFILHVGRLSLANKAQDVLLAAFRVLRREFPDLDLIFVGDGPDRAKLKRLVRTSGLDNAVHICGWQSNVAAYMSRAEILVLCSHNEGWPMALAEAMACGCPVIAADCPTGPREILGDSEYGILVPMNSPEALADAIRSLLKDRALRSHYQGQARIRVENYARSQIGRRYASLLSGVFNSITVREGKTP